ncbi:MAG: hypothetical protein ACTHZ9_12390 [Leucobacter sp.]
MSSKVNIGRVYARHIQTRTAPTVTAMTMIGDFAISKQVFQAPSTGTPTRRQTT